MHVGVFAIVGGGGLGHGGNLDRAQFRGERVRGAGTLPCTGILYTYKLGERHRRSASHPLTLFLSYPLSALYNAAPLRLLGS